MRHAAAGLVSAATVALVAPAVSPAFRNVSIGDSIENRTLPTIEGRKERLLGSAKANVFVFFRAGHDHSVEALRQIADVERELAGKSVRWVGIVSSSDARDEVLAIVRSTRVRMPVLVDQDDSLYGELGVYLHPSIGIADARHRLAAYQPFRKVNLRDLIQARVQLVLGEITEAQLAQVIEPPAAPVASGGRARARVKLARMLLSAGKVDDAIASLRSGLALEPDLAEAHAALAEALARKGSCAEAESEQKTALRLAPEEAPRASPITCRR
jgi:tetratricopeptide (TPR) repeat protein